MPGYAVIDTPLAGWAPLGGIYAVTLAQLLFAALVAVALSCRLAWLAVPVIGAALIAGTGQVSRQHAWSEPSSTVDVRIIQPALPVVDAYTRANPAQRIEALFPAAFKPWPASDRPRLLLTPEGIVNVPVSRLGREAAGRLVLLQEKTEARVLFNGFRKDGPRFFNTSFVLDEGQIAYRLDKRELVPFGEYVPAGFHWFVEMIGIPMSDLMRGDAVQPLLSLGGADAGILICYENLYGSVVRTFWQSRSPDFLIVTSNLGWFRTLRARTAPHDEPHARDGKRKAAGEREQHGHERPRQFEGRDRGHAQDRWSRCRDHAASGRHGFAHALCEARQLARAARIAHSGALRRARPLRDSQNPSGQGKGLIIKSLSSRFRQEREGSSFLNQQAPTRIGGIENDYLSGSNPAPAGILEPPGLCFAATDRLGSRCRHVPYCDLSAGSGARNPGVPPTFSPRVVRRTPAMVKIRTASTSTTSSRSC